MGISAQLMEWYYSLQCCRFIKQQIEHCYAQSKTRNRLVVGHMWSHCSFSS